MIQTLYELTVAVSASATPEVLSSNLQQLVSDFTRLSSTSEAVPDAVALPREVIQYVEDGRNPDIYTREFVELVVKENQGMKAKLKAFRDFRDELAAQMVVAFPELKGEVEKVLDGTGGK